MHVEQDDSRVKAPRFRVRRGREKSRGQGLVEFAISFPLVLLMVLFGVDFGRVFLGWVTLTGAVREAANFAALNPNAWNVPGSPTARAEYARLINAESDEINCTMPATLPAPTFPSGNDLGSPAVVAITCEFHLITPILGSLLASPIDVSASASFPIRSGAVHGIPVGVGLPSFSPAAPTVIPPPTVDPSLAATPIPTPSTAPTPVPTCIVPDFNNVHTNSATGTWTTAGFSANNLVFNPLVPPHYRIKKQTLTKGDSVSCSSSMTVSP
jgi:hypothetical protein